MGTGIIDKVALEKLTLEVFRQLRKHEAKDPFNKHKKPTIFSDCSFYTHIMCTVVFTDSQDDYQIRKLIYVDSQSQLTINCDIGAPFRCQSIGQYTIIEEESKDKYYVQINYGHKGNVYFFEFPFDYEFPTSTEY